MPARAIALDGSWKRPSVAASVEIAATVAASSTARAAPPDATIAATVTSPSSG